MRKSLFDILIILSMAGLLTLLNQFDLLKPSAKFAMIPLLAYYFLGRYVERNFGTKKKPQEN